MKKPKRYLVRRAIANIRSGYTIRGITIINKIESHIKDKRGTENDTKK